MANDIRNDDAEFAQRFVAQHGHELKYVYEDRAWVAWKGGRWSNTAANCYSRGTQTANSIFEQMKDPSLTNRERQDLFAMGKRYRNTGPIDLAMKQAAEMLGISKKEFDADPNVINCKNGVLDLATKALEPHAGQLVLKQVAVRYDPEAKCPRWLKFLDEIFEGNEELVEYVRLALGYSVSGSVNEHLAFFLYGGGRNGKDKLVNVVRKIMGDYAGQTNFELLLSNDPSNVRVSEAKGNLMGLRLAQASETQDGRRLNEALFKELTGGNAIEGAGIRQKKFTFEPSHKFWLTCNHRPAIKDGTNSTWERVRVIPFNRQFLGEDRDIELETKLLSEREGIFAWLVQAAFDYIEAGELPKPPAICVEAERAYRDDNDDLSKFIRERMEKIKDAKVGVKATYQVYEAWCYANGIDARSLQYFRQDMSERGVTAKESKQSGWEFQHYRVRLDQAPKPEQPAFEPNGYLHVERMTEEEHEALYGV